MILTKSENHLDYNYILKHSEKYLKTFLEDGEVPMDNNSAEQAIRPFCVGKKNGVMIAALRSG